MGGTDEGKMRVTEETLIKSKWRRKTRWVEIDRYYRP